MAIRRRLLRYAGTAGVAGLAGCLHGGDDGDGSADGGGDGSGNGDGSFTDDFTVTSEAFAEGESIPERYTTDHADVSPPLSFEGVPEDAETLALVCDDPDAPGGTFVHWLLWNVPGGTDGLEEDVPPDEEVSGLGGARQGTNDFGNIGYEGPAPPEGDGSHTYRFTVYAVETTLELAAGAERGALDDALDGSTLGSGRLSGEYER